MTYYGFIPQPDEVLMFFYPNYKETEEIRTLQNKLNSALWEPMHAYPWKVIYLLYEKYPQEIEKIFHREIRNKGRSRGYEMHVDNIQYKSPEEIVEQIKHDFLRYCQLYRMIQRYNPKELKKYRIVFEDHGYTVKLCPYDTSASSQACVKFLHDDLCLRFNIHRHAEVVDYLIVEEVGELLLVKRKKHHHSHWILSGAVKPGPRPKRAYLLIKPDLGSTNGIRKYKVPVKTNTVYEAAKFLHNNTRRVISETALNAIFIQRAISFSGENEKETDYFSGGCVIPRRLKRK